MTALQKKDYSHRLYTWKNEMGKGRCVMLTNLVLSNIITVITGGVFYTSFLLQNGINLVNIGIITFMPSIAACFAIFSPYILERFEKRKWLLASVRLISNSLSLLGTTLISPMIADPGTRTTVFVILIFTSSIINALFSSGYTVWHLNFIPDNVRIRYFSSSHLVMQLLSSFAGVIAAIIADALANSAYAYTIIAGLRYTAFGLVLLDTFLLTRPKEFPYPQTSRPKISHIFTKPLGHKKFRLMMLLVLMHSFSQSTPSAVLNVFLLEEVGVSFVYIQIINFAYPFVLMIFTRFARRRISQLGWIAAYALFQMMVFPTNIAYAFVNTGNYLILMTAVRLIQHCLGSTCNIAYQNFAYLHAPKEEQTNYIAFYTLVVNLGSFLGTSLGTAFVAIFPDFAMTIFGTQMGHAQALLLLCAACQLITTSTALFLRKKYDLDHVDEAALAA